MILFAGILLWLGFGLASWCAYQGAHKNACYAWLPPRNLQALVFALSGPIGFFTVASVNGLEHWSFFPITKEERWEIWKNRGWDDSPEDRAEFERYQ